MSEKKFLIFFCNDLTTILITVICVALLIRVTLT